MGRFLFKDRDAPAGATERLAGEGSDVMAPLNGLYTYPEVAQAFTDAMEHEQMQGLMKFVVQANGAVKYGLTVLAPTTAARNWQSAMLFALANGHFDMRHVAKSLSGLREYFSSQGSGAKLAYLRRLQELGVVYDTPYAGQMMDLLSDATTEDDLLAKPGKMGIKKVLGYANKFHQYGDDFWKIVGFENEKNMLMNRAGMDLETAEREAAERIRNTYPTYSMVPRAIKSLRRFPLAGPFVAFTSEIMRTQAHMLRYIAHDLKTPGMRSIGAQRAVGTAVFAAPQYIVHAALEASKYAIIAGVFAGAQALSKALFDIDDDEEDAIRQMAAPWNQNSNLFFTGRNKRGDLQYFDMSFLDPYNYFKRPINAMLRDQPWQQSATDSLWELTQPFLGSEIGTAAVGAVIYNQKPGTDSPIYHKGDSAVEQGKDIAGFLGHALRPGFVSNVEKTYSAIQGQYKTNGQKYNLHDELMSWVGWRKTTLDPKVALYYRAFDFNDKISNSTHDLYHTLRSPTPDARRPSTTTRCNRNTPRPFRSAPRRSTIWATWCRQPAKRA